MSQHQPPSTLPNSWALPRRRSSAAAGLRLPFEPAPRAVRLAQLGDVAAQDVLDLGHQQFLVLLLVLDAGVDQEAEAIEVLVLGAVRSSSTRASTDSRKR